ncbi:hypothetical protein GCM10010260_83880 [Streptomyces filipinensis]|uniref:Uncharacterized protein n=1 Tax=Streptomyces filipinensis TaxID=66887 RepID=A0A918ILA3_9ACTN|nr:hypothetical protein GCM10010260_83880 [Streptomyces filipinensis]
MGPPVSADPALLPVRPRGQAQIGAGHLFLRSQEEAQLLSAGGRRKREQARPSGDPKLPFRIRR